MNGKTHEKWKGLIHSNINECGDLLLLESNDEQVKTETLNR